MNFDRDSRIRMAGRFLRDLFAPYETGFCEIRCMGHTGQRTQEFHELPLKGETLRVIATCCVNMADQQFDVYVGVLPRTTKKGKAESVHEAAWLWADVDKKNTDDETIEEAVAASDMAVHSGGGVHCYKRLGRTLSLTEEKSRAAFVKTCRSWQTFVSPVADNVADLPRILRVPGTWNWKKKDAPKAVFLTLHEKASTTVFAYKYTKRKTVESEGLVSPLNPPSKQPSFSAGLEGEDSFLPCAENVSDATHAIAQGVASETHSASLVDALISAARNGELPRLRGLKVPSGRVVMDGNAAVRGREDNYLFAVEQDFRGCGPIMLGSPAHPVTWREIIDREAADLIFLADHYAEKGAIHA